MAWNTCTIPATLVCRSRVRAQCDHVERDIFAARSLRTTVISQVNCGGNQTLGERGVYISYARLHAMGCSARYHLLWSMEANNDCRLLTRSVCSISPLFTVVSVIIIEEVLSCSGEWEVLVEVPSEENYTDSGMKEWCVMWFYSSETEVSRKPVR